MTANVSCFRTPTPSAHQLQCPLLSFPALFHIDDCDKLIDGMGDRGILPPSRSHLESGRAGRQSPATAAQSS